MQTVERSQEKRVFYERHDLIPIPEDIPEIGIEKGGFGTIRTLDFRSDNHVVALVEVSFSTGQTRGRVEVGILPEEKVEKVLAFESV